MTAPTSAERVVGELHRAGRVGATVAELAAFADVPQSRVKEILDRLKKKQPARAVIIGIHRDPITKDRRRTDERWACRCPLPHHDPRRRDDELLSFELTDEERRRGLEGVAAARQALEDAVARRHNARNHHVEPVAA